MKLDPLVSKWFSCWQTGNLDELPIASDFTHTSPFGTIKTKAKYLQIVANNKAEFLDNKLTVTRQIKQGNQICVQFEQINTTTGLEMTVCEWYTLDGDKIKEIRSFYNVGNAVIKG